MNTFNGGNLFFHWMSECKWLTFFFTMRANLKRITGWSINRLPNTFLWCAHWKHSSTATRAVIVALVSMLQRSWLKLERITKSPLFSWPSKFSTGTFTYDTGSVVTKRNKTSYIFKRHIGSSGRRRIRCLDQLCFNPFCTLNQKHR